MSPVYEYKCSARHISHVAYRGDWVTCETLNCYNIAHRVFSFQIARSFPEHYNNSTGSYVNTETEFRDQLKRQSEIQSRESGFDTEYEYISPADMQERSALGVTDEGLETTHRRAHDSKTV